ncbi:sugar transporter [Syncephalastrum racemosum]|uniref:Sugar transporter n=1 Tax=Syncephalastrum racemosum TaxID=13706 RepID=A0A1X2HXF0_SYNRA|nr:sugar transporter [Syncephalastrum racemosum]
MFPQHPGTRLYLICSFVSLGGYMYGYDTGMLSGCLVMARFQSQFSVSDLPNAAIVASVPLVASVFASILSGFIADRIGRRPHFFVATAIKLIGSVVQMTADSFATLLVGRILAGAAIGIFSMLVPLYQSEISRPGVRGRLITFYQFGVTVGLCVAFWIDYGTSHIPNNLSWRIPIGLQILPPIVMFIGLFALPESPRWLIYRGRFEEAHSILTRLRSNEGECQMEFIGIVQDVTFDKNYSSKKSYSTLLQKGIENNRRRTLLGIGIHMLTQLTGINVLLFYLPHILQSTGITEVNSELLGNGVSGLVNMLATIPVFFFIDKWDRRRILKAASISMAVCMIMIATVLGVYSDQMVQHPGHFYPGAYVNVTVNISNDSATFGVLALLCLFVACFALSWGPLGWIYPAEIYPQLIRAKAMGVTTAASYCFNVAISQLAPLLFEYITWGTYVVFGCCCLLITWIVHVYYPETRGRSLEEIHLIFSNALIDQRPGAHHPSTAAEALEHLELAAYDNQHQQPITNGKHPIMPKLL